MNYVKFKHQMGVLEKNIEKQSLKTSTTLGDLEYHIQGSGKPVLVIHGAGGDYDQGLLLAKTFTGHQAKLISISRPGFLGTELTDDNKTPMNHADMYGELIDKLDLSSAHVIAFSDGGPSALQFALRHPEKCESLTLVACKTKQPPKETFMQKLVFSNIFKADFLFWLIARYGEDSLLETFGVTPEVLETMTDGEKALIHDFLDAMQPMSLRVDGIYNERDQLSNLVEADYPLEDIETRTLIIHAKDDTLQLYDYDHSIITSIPNLW